MRSLDIRVDVTSSSDRHGPRETASTVHLPDHIDGPLTVLVAYPGGGYGRGYYNIAAPGNYSQAWHHTDDGFAVIACDHLGVGDSSRHDPFGLDFETLAAANHATVREILRRLTVGELAPDLPPQAIAGVVGIGQSFGGALLTVQQGRHGTFDGVALLGWSGIHTMFPVPGGGYQAVPVPPRGADLSSHVADIVESAAALEEHFRFCFHWPDSPAELREADFASYGAEPRAVRGSAELPWGSDATPPCAILMLAPGVVSAEAAAIDVSVLVACGERDVVSDPHAEPVAYRNSPDVSVAVYPRMAHMHNFAATRHQLWERIAHFARTVPPRPRSGCAEV